MRTSVASDTAWRRRLQQFDPCSLTANPHLRLVNMANLLDFPSELLLKIVSAISLSTVEHKRGKRGRYGSPTDLISLSNACKKAHDLCLPAVYADVCTTEHIRTEQLCRTLRSRPELACYVRTFRVESTHLPDGHDLAPEAVTRQNYALPPFPNCTRIDVSGEQYTPCCPSLIDVLRWCSACPR